MLSKETVKSIQKIAAGVFILTLLMLAVFALSGHFGSGEVLGALIGASEAILNFVLLGITLEKTVAKDKKGASSLTGLSYIGRLMLTAAVVIWAIKAPYINYIAAIIPLVFPQIIIKIIGVAEKKRSDKK